MEETPSFSPAALRTLSLLLLFAAILLAVIPVSSDSSHDTCGSVINGMKNLTTRGWVDGRHGDLVLGTVTDTRATKNCDESLRSRRNISFTVAGIGIVLLIASSINPTYSNSGKKSNSEKSFQFTDLPSTKSPGYIPVEGLEIFCSACEEMVSESSKFCPSCGEILGEEVEIVIEEQSPACPNPECESIPSEGAVFCDQCGTAV